MVMYTHLHLTGMATQLCLTRGVTLISCQITTGAPKSVTELAGEGPVGEGRPSLPHIKACADTGKSYGEAQTENNIGRKPKG